MRVRSLLSAVALAGGLLIAPAAVTAADASTAVAAVCQYRQSGNHWVCVTPGAYCPRAAHGKYGYAKVTNRRYRCSVYSNGQWRWKRS